MWQLMKLSLLQQILLALNPSAMTDPQTLLDQAKCYQCMGGPGEWQLMELALLAQIVANGGGGGGGATGSVLCGAVDPTVAPSSTCAVYINTVSGQIFWFYGGSWQ